MKHYLINVFSGYAMSFIGALFLYSLDFCQSYPELSHELKVFLFASSIIMVFVGIVCAKRGSFDFRETHANQAFLRFGLAFIYISYAVQCLFAGYVPIINALLGREFDYMNFGIKYFKVFVAAFTSFYMIHSFHIFLSESGNGNGCIRTLGYVLAAFFVPIMIMSRGMFMFNFIACCYLLFLKMEIRIRVVLFSVVVCVFLLLGFGLLGNVRSHEDGGEALIVDIAKPTSAFDSTRLPETCLWGYVYATCSLGNLQSMMDEGEHPERSFKRFVLHNFLPQTFSKLLVDFDEDAEAMESLRIDVRLTTATAFRESYFYAGSIGMFLNFCLMLCFPLVIMRVIPGDSPYYMTSVANLFLMMIFASFSNILVMPAYCFVFVFAWFFDRRWRVARARRRAIS